MDSNNNKATILTTMLSILLKEVSFFDKPLLDTLNPHLKSKRFWYLCVTVYFFFYLFLLIQSLTSLFKTLPSTRTRYILIFRSNLFFLHLIRRFWNQTRTCVSVRPSRAERRRLCCPEMYWSVMKTFSSSCSWWAEKTVRPLCGLVTLSSRAREELSSKRGEPVRKESKSFKNQLKPISLQKWISNSRLDFLFFLSFFFQYCCSRSTIFLKIPKVQESFCRDERPRHTSHEVFFTSIAQFVLYRFNFSRAYFHNAT